MKIAFVYPSFPPANGGVENYIKHLADRYHEQNHDIAIFMTDREEKKIKQPYPVYKTKTRNIFGYRIPKRRRLHRLQQFEPDVIHYNGPHPFTTAAAFYMRKLKTKRVLTYHAHVNPQNPFIRFIAFFERQFYRWFFDQIIVTSEYYKHEVSKFFPKEKITIIPPGVNDIFKSSTLEPLKKFFHRKPTILFVGALDNNHRYKGVDVLLKCAALTPDYKYTIIGDGKRKKHFMHKARHHENVQFLGYVPDNKLVHYYQSANLFILPSTSNSEGFGTVLLEAMACGVPTLTTHKVGSSDFLRKKKASYIVKSNNQHSLKKGIETVLNDKELQNQLTAHGTKMAKSLTWPYIASETIKTYMK